MKITCPQCQTAYDVAPAALGSGGRQVRCARCQSMWFAELPNPPENFVPSGGDDVHPEQSTEAAFAGPRVPADFGPVAPESVPAGVEPPDANAGEPAPAEEPEANRIVAVETALLAVEQAMMSPAAGETATPGPGAVTVKAEASSRKALAAEPPAVDIETLASRRPSVRRPKRRPHPVWHARGLTAAIVVLAVIDAGLVMGRAEVVRALPQTASLFEAIGMPVNLRNLAFKDIKTAQERHEGAPILVVEGAIVATGRTPTDVPRLRFAISAANGHEIYAWTAVPTRTKLAPGETLPFRTRLASPPEQGRSIKIRFFNRRDIAAGLS